MLHPLTESEPSLLHRSLVIAGLCAVIAVLVAGGLLLDHYSPRTEYGPTLHEPATVTDTIYTPPASHHRSGYVPSMDEDGDIHMRYREWVDHTPAVYGVVFRCQHGQFVSQGSDQRHKLLWGKLPKFSQVDVTYREIYRVHHDGRREIVGLDFLDARVVARQGPAEAP